MTIFLAISEHGKLSLGSEYNAARFRQFLKDNAGIRLRIEPVIPESRKQRNYFEGAVLPLVTYYQEGMDFRDTDDLRKVREWLKQEFCPVMVIVGGKAKTLPGSTKGKLQKELLERVMDWMKDQGYKVELLDPKKYQKWKDEIYPYGGPATYIEYLISLKLL